MQGFKIEWTGFQIETDRLTEPEVPNWLADQWECELKTPV